MEEGGLASVNFTLWFITVDSAKWKRIDTKFLFIDNCDSKRNFL